MSYFSQSAKSSLKHELTEGVLETGVNTVVLTALNMTSLENKIFTESDGVLMRNVKIAGLLAGANLIRNVAEKYGYISFQKIRHLIP